MRSIIRVADMSMSGLLLRLSAVLLICMPVPASAWALTEGRLGFIATAEGESFEAWFDDFTVRPSLGGTRPLAFEAEIGLGSVDSGYPDRDIEMRGPDWLDAEGHPLASFHGTSVESVAAGFLVHGDLTLKGAVRTLAVPFHWEASADRLAMRGRVDVDRRWFGIGPAEVDAVAPTVTVIFEFVWMRADD